MDEQKFKTVITFEVQTADGQPFCDGKIVYHNQSYQSLVVVESALLSALGELNAVATSRIPK
jgi:hypothetical protein